jgi:hypothetical protein
MSWGYHIYKPISHILFKVLHKEMQHSDSHMPHHLFRKSLMGRIFYQNYTLFVSGVLLVLILENRASPKLKPQALSQPHTTAYLSPPSANRFNEPSTSSDNRTTSLQTKFTQPVEMTQLI